MGMKEYHDGIIWGIVAVFAILIWKLEGYVGDKGLQRRLIRERDESYYDDKWVRSIDAYRVLCPEDPMGLEGMRHRAIDDAVMEAWVLKAIIDLAK